MLAPVAMGVVKFDGSSEVKMVALEGEMRYFAFRVVIRASLKPGSIVSYHIGPTFTRLAFDFTAVA